MAEPIGLATGLIALATFAFQSSVALRDTVKSFRSHQRRVHDLVDELGALAEVLGALSDRPDAETDRDLASLKSPPRKDAASRARNFKKSLGGVADAATTVVPTFETGPS